MAVKIKLMRLGKIRAPYYRIVVADSRTKRDGRAIETIGKYHPTEEPSRIELDSERAQYWLGVGAQPTEPVAAILKVTGDWQKFRGEAGAEGTLRTAEPKTDKKAVFEAAAKDSAGEPKDGATTAPKKRAASKKAAEAAAEGTPDAARPTADEAAADGNPREAGKDSAGKAAADASSTDVGAESTSDDAAKADVGTAQGAPAIEETTSVTSTETVKDEG